MSDLLYVCEEYETPYEEGYRVVRTIEEHNKIIYNQALEYVKDFAECLRVDCYKNCNIEFIDSIDYVLEKFLAGEYEQQIKEMKNKLK